MGDIRSVRKFNFEGEPVCIAEELTTYMDISTPIGKIIADKNLQKGYDFEIIPRHLVDNKINLNRYRNKNEVILLKQNGLAKIINNRRQSEAIDVAKAFGLKLGFIKEREYLRIIKAAFEDYNCVQQYFVPKEDKNGYFIDLYISGEDKNIAVEVDENGHSSYDSEFELKREKYIKEKLGCEFIRFNPDDENFNIGKVINKIINTKNNNVNTAIEYIEYSEESLLSINEALNELDAVSPSIIGFVEALEIENINNELGSKISYKKDMYSDSDFIITVNDTHILNTKDIINEAIIDKEEQRILQVTISYYNQDVGKSIKLCYEFNENIINIKLADGLRKKIYIKDYFDSLALKK